MWLSEKTRRLNTVWLILIAVFTVLILRMAWLQLFHGAQYKQFADENRIRNILYQAPRGSIFDRNGVLLVTNRPSFAISIIPAEFVYSDKIINSLAQILEMTASEIDSRFRVGKNLPYTPIRLKQDVNDTVVAKIEERKNDLPGVIVEAVPVRNYIYKELASQVFGYVGSISEEEYIKLKEQDYLPNDIIGKDGIEKVWERVLKGVNGGRLIETNAIGEEIRFLGIKNPVPGNSLVLTIDVNLQKLSEDALHDQIAASIKSGQPAKGGAAIVIEIKTGSILAMANIPGFDPNLFAGGIKSSEWNKLINDVRRPLTNRAIQNSYPPGSVFKIVSACAALEDGLTNANEVFDDRGVYYLNGWAFYGWETKGLGKLTVIDALGWSSDPVFYELGRRLGPNRLASYALTFGFGKQTGIKLPGEDGGNVPTPEWKLAVYNDQWYPGETLISAIGQGYYLATPLQQAMLLMATANGGNLYRPRLVDRVISPDGQVIQEYPPEIYAAVYLRPEVWQTVQKGLEAVVTRGTAKASFQGAKYTLAGKTGSAETGRNTTHSWFACYAPIDDPKIAVVAFVEEGGEGSAAAAPVVRKILDGYFNVK